MNNPFRSIEISAETQIKVNDLYQSFLNLHEKVKESTTPSREQSIAMTKLEESCMWAIKNLCLKNEDK